MIGFIDAFFVQSVLITTNYRNSQSIFSQPFFLDSRELAPFSLSFYDSWLQLKVMLRPTVSRPVRLGIKHPSGAYDQIFITVWRLQACWCVALSLTRGRVCHLPESQSAVVMTPTEQRWFLYPLGTDHAQKTQIFYFCVRVCWGSHVIATQPVHWRASCCLATVSARNT
jgi:hypothetical protein